MINIIIGAAVISGAYWLINYTKKQQLSIKWWGWLITTFGFLYAVFVLEVITAFLAEGTGRGALVIGLMLGIIGIIWGVLLGRFVFKKKIDD